MIDLNRLDEVIEVMPYNPAWLGAFILEAAAVKAVFASGRIPGVEHYGSTAVPGLCAKPVVDILLGLDEFKISTKEIRGLEKLGYEFVGQIHPGDERFYARKRQIDKNFNLGIVKFGTANWERHLLVRDYLRAHPQEADAYAKLKLSAVDQGICTLIKYHQFKDAFVERLDQKARAWAAGKSRP